MPLCPYKRVCLIKITYTSLCPMRLIIKTFTYSICHLTAAIAIAYAITGNIWIALSIGIIEPIAQVFVFAGHDWLWERGPLKLTLR